MASSLTKTLNFFFSSRRRHTRLSGDWSSDVCSSDLQWHQQLGQWEEYEMSAGLNGLTAARLREVLSYCQETGDFCWREKTNRRIVVGSKAGCVGRFGYVQIRVDGVKHYAHRLAWLYIHGSVPVGVIDHKNGVRSDNAISNLRVVTKEHNQQNRRLPQSNNSLGTLGVCRSAGSFKAQISIAGSTKYLGSFQTEDEAHEAYLLAKRRNHAGNTL